MMTYQIATIYNDPAQYAAMQASFVAAGFDAPRARFTPLDNSRANRFDPYAVLASFAGARTIPETAGDEPCVILCHQDVRLDLGDGLAALDAVIARVESADPEWTLLGNAGFTYRRQSRRWLNDPDGHHRTAARPVAVLSLDENFLVLNRRRFPRPTPGLRGFHLYATDAVLNAALSGRRSYVVPFLVTHLSRGNVTSPEFRLACQRFEAAWTDRLFLGVINTPCAYFTISRRPLVRWLLKRWRVRGMFAWLGITFAPTWGRAWG